MKFIKEKNSVNFKLLNDEQITLKFLNSEYDIARKNWGYYVTPSLQKRCKLNNLDGAIVYDPIKRMNNFVLINKKKKELFKKFLARNNLKIISWVNNNKNFKNFF
tara:strand:- start:45 stop:359 length:315 start_codon:yes stop_codon:yes gene_type:complete